MLPLKNNSLYIIFLSIIFFQSLACKTSQSPLPTINKEVIQSSKLGGGSSGMEQLSDQSYLVVYDVKNFREGIRLAMIQINEEDIQVSPIQVLGWGDEGKSSDLESICKIPGKTDEYFMAESGNWKGNLGRIFHIQVDTTQLSAKVLGITKLPFKDINNPESVGDQYESMSCLPYNENERIVIIAERGGSKVNPRGIIRWGIYNLITHQLKFSDLGIKGISVDAPGDWTDKKRKRDITDLHIDKEGAIWASASEDISEMGPFYSVIYQIGQVNTSNKERPFNIFSKFSTWEVISGFKIEALSASSKNIKGTHSFGTEDENFGGVWRVVSIEKK